MKPPALNVIGESSFPAKVVGVGLGEVVGVDVVVGVEVPSAVAEGVAVDGAIASPVWQASNAIINTIILKYFLRFICPLLCRNDVLWL